MIAFLAALALAPAQPALAPGLEPMRFLIGRCWRGRLPKPAEEDVHCFDAVYDGKHVRDVHEVQANGTTVYRGETIYTADGAEATYTYWSSDGGIMRGAMHAAPDGLDFGRSTFRGADGREIALSTFWRRIGDDAYEAVTRSMDTPSLNRTVRYTRVADAVSVSKARGIDGSHSLTHEAIVDAPVAEVWNAISTVDGWKSWAVPVAWAPDPNLIETSYDPAAKPGDKSTIRQRLIAQLPGRMLVFSTVKAPDGFPDFDTYAKVTSVFELEPVDGSRTRVRLTGTGYADTEAGRRLLGFFEQGNTVSMEQLRARFATGPIDWTAKRATAH